ncbi:hypothetical protein CERSUDRAFT_35051, partial [Gelatoporia subvermispora B]
GKLVLLVIRNFSGPEKLVLDWINKVVDVQVDQRRNIRMEDSGKMVQSGWSAGSRSKSAFNWVRNILSKALSAEQVASSNFQASSAFALFWNMARNRLPAEVLADFNNWLSTGIYRMNSAQPHSERGDYGILEGPSQVFIHDAEMAPPGGVFARNYSRPVHKETQPHTWAASWTTDRNGGPEMGVHFILALWGIKVEAAKDTFIVWNPHEEHGTTLPNVAPGADSSLLAAITKGMAIVTSARIMGVWDKYINQEWSEE